MNNSIGERIKALRKDKGWGQALLAEKMNVVQSLVAKVEGGKRNLTVEETIRLAEIFGTSTDYILRGIKPDFVNVASDLGLSETAIENLRNVQSLVQEKGKEGGKFDNQDVANFIVSYDGWHIVDAIAECLNTPKDATVNAQLGNAKEGRQYYYPVNHYSLLLVRLQDVLSQIHDMINGGI